MVIATATPSFHFGKFLIRQTHSSSRIRHCLPSGGQWNLYYPCASLKFARFGSKCSITDTEVHLDHVTADKDEGHGRRVVEPYCPVPFVKLKIDILESVFEPTNIDYVVAGDCRGGMSPVRVMVPALTMKETE
ncbi:Solute carrier family 40 member 3 [Spatholobus suberectus]|nr:Solute carrier family 40 member 3 [Spatholobus suberectus]